MDFERLWTVADRARSKTRLSSSDITFVRDVVPAKLAAYPELKLPATIRHPEGFSVSGASVKTFRWSLGKHAE